MHKASGVQIIRHVTIDDLSKSDQAVVPQEVEALRLHACRVHLSPFQVLPGHLGVRGRLCLFGDGLDGRGPIDGFLGSGHIGHPGSIVLVV